MKQCSKCSRVLELSEFPKRVAKDNGKVAQCKKCVAEYKAALYISNQKQEREKHKNNYFKKSDYYRAKSREYYHRTCEESNLKRRLKKYELSLPEYLKMLDVQKNSCAICGCAFAYEKSCAIDHCHQTGKVRGLLCDNCNTSLGLMKDSTEILLNAVRYLEKCKK